MANDPDPVLVYLYKQTLASALRLASAKALLAAGYDVDVPMADLEADVKGEAERAWAYCEYVEERLPARPAGASDVLAEANSEADFLTLG